MGYCEEVSHPDQMRDMRIEKGLARFEFGARHMIVINMQYPNAWFIDKLCRAVKSTSSAAQTNTTKDIIYFLGTNQIDVEIVVVVVGMCPLFAI